MKMNITQLLAVFLAMPFKVFGHIPEALGSVAPPANLHGYSMTDITDHRATFMYVSDVAGIGGDTLDFEYPVSHREAGGGWWPTPAGWGHGYDSDVYWTGFNKQSLRMDFPADTCAFIFYLQSNLGGTYHFVITYSNGEEIEEDILSSPGGAAEGFAIAHDHNTHGFPVSVNILVEVTTWGFAVGEFSMALCTSHDIDGDGVPHPIDVCRGYDDNLDADLDGVPDGCDICPNSDDTLDADLDGIPDGCDNCPNDANPCQEDTDMDGVGDICDLCPDHDDNIDANNNGVPDDCECCFDYHKNVCANLPNGRYQSCAKCDEYIHCSNGYAYKMPCAPANPPLQFDANTGSCLYESSTAHCCS